MNGFELNKVVASILVAGIIAMLASFGARFIYKDNNTNSIRGYQVEVTEDNDNIQTGSSSFQWPSFEIGKLMANADPEKGKAVFRKCSVCHSDVKGGPNKVGPGLWNVLGSDIGKHEGYSYSAALSKGGKWNYENLFKFIYSPKEYAKGTKMGFVGIKKHDELADVIAYLRTLHDSPPPLPDENMVLNNN